MTTQELQNYDFEEKIEELKTLVSKLEVGEDTLKNSLSYYEDGLKLAEELKQYLEAIKVKLVVFSDKK